MSRGRVKRNNLTHPQRVQSLARQEEALGLRRLGLSYARIAERMGCSRGQGYKYVAAAVDVLARRVSESAEFVRTLELERLDALTHVAMTKALATRDMRAVEACLRIQERRSKLLGLDAPAPTQRLEHSGPGGLPLGLPPQLAMLEPAPSPEEVEHFIATDSAASCFLVVCRIHRRDAPALAAATTETLAPPAETGETTTS
jgi:hypothetical protein